MPNPSARISDPTDVYHAINARTNPPNLELAELLDRLASSGQHAQDVEADSLAERAALANSDLVTVLETESGRNVDAS